MSEGGAVESGIAVVDVVASDKFQGIETTKSSLRVVDPSMTLDRMLGVVAGIRDLRGATNFWIGDALRFAESRWGESYSQVMDETGLSYGRLTSIVWTCGQVEPGRRRDDLDYSHHEAVAALEPADQTEWLEAAASSGWTKDQLRDALKEANAVAKTPRAKPEPQEKAEKASAAQTVDAARHLGTIRETLDLVRDALDPEGEADAQETVGELEAKLPQAMQALDAASEPIRRAALGAELEDLARKVIKEATVSGDFAMVPLGVFQSFKAAVPAG